MMPDTFTDNNGNIFLTRDEKNRYQCRCSHYCVPTTRWWILKCTNPACGGVYKIPADDPVNLRRFKK